MLSRIAYCNHFSQSQHHAGFSINTMIDLLSVLLMKAEEKFLFQVSTLVTGQLYGITMSCSEGFLAEERLDLCLGTSYSMNPRF